MRMIFSLVSLLLVVAVIGILAKNQLKSISGLPVVPQISAKSEAGSEPHSATSVATPANIREQSQQMQQQVRDQIGQAMEAASNARAQAIDK